LGIQKVLLSKIRLIQRKVKVLLVFELTFFFFFIVLDVIEYLFGPEVNDSLAPIDVDLEWIRIQGLLPSPDLDAESDEFRKVTRGSDDRIFTFVNQRPVHLNSIVKVIKEAFRKRFSGTIPSTSLPTYSG